MRRYSGLAVALLMIAAAAPAQTPDPLRLLPPSSDVCVVFAKPKQAVEHLFKGDYARQVMELTPVREALASTNIRRFEQFLGYYEDALGVDRFEILDRLAGGGAALSAHYDDKSKAVLIVVQGKDEEFVRKFFQVAISALEAELKRENSKDDLVKGAYRDCPTLQIGKEAYFGLLGSAIAFCNRESGLKGAIDLYREPSKKSLAQVVNVGKARKLLPPEPLAWAWWNFEPLQAAPKAKELFVLPRNDANLTVLFGGYLDLAGRTPYLCVGAYADAAGPRLTIRMPAGRDGLAEALSTHVPAADQPGSRPLLQPKNVLFSTSYYFDLAKIWENRAKLFTEGQLKGFDQADKNKGVTAFLGGKRISQLLTQAGPYQRFVAAHQPKSGYQAHPEQQIPAFAFVQEMRDAENFARTLELVLRLGGLGAATQFKLKLIEEEVQGCKLIGYRFKEDESLKADSANLRFNFSPCFVVVGNQFLAASTMELGRELIGILKKEDREKRSSKAVVQTQFYSAGGVALLRATEDSLVTLAILDQALPVDAAKSEVEKLLALVRQLGVLRLDANYGPKSFQYNVSLRPAK